MQAIDEDRMIKKSYKAYAAATQTMAKTKQIILLYDAVIRYVQQAEEAIKNKQIEARFNALDKACTIVFGLQGCLDFEQGGDIAQTLYSFYSSIDARLLRIQRDNNAESCAQIIKELKMMREAWSEIDAADVNDEPEELNKAESSNASEPDNGDGSVAISA